MDKSDKESRKFRRYDVDSVNGKMIYSSDINILNISMDGAAIATTQRLVIDREYSLKLKFEGRVLTLRGRVVWSVLSHSRTSKKGEAEPVYKAGIRFTSLQTDEAAELISYIERNRTGDIEKRILGMRFKMGPQSSAVIDMSHEYEIRRISLSGMLIETDSPYEIDSVHEMEICLEGVPVSVMGRIANQIEVKERNITKYDVGIEFVSMDSSTKERLTSYMESMEEGKNRK